MKVLGVENVHLYIVRIELFFFCILIGVLRGEW